ncbi:MAG TPA: enoyl-CoA hydratase-related protein [Candidatus Kapabacteria bacterium]|nr:enoyl-CoA hydratase-related protein [Candidatus Kapabacteria bacterium]
MEYGTILFDKHENYAIITLNRPDKLNALNEQLFTELNDVITKVELDSTIKALILTGSGEKAFAAGADITELNKSDIRSGKLFSNFGSKVMLRLEMLKIPVIAAINGFALGGGCELAMACHIRFCSSNAKFGQPEVNLGIIPGYGGTQRLTKIVGKSMAMELILSANIINADEALRIGLVNHVYPLEELMVKSFDFVNLILSKGTIAISAAVDCINMSEQLSLTDGLHYESSKFGEICGTKDFKEGTLAFIEKRKPNFIGE